jgi:hypothetical protein
MSEEELVDALHESIFDALAPKEKDYDRSEIIERDADGRLLYRNDGPSSDEAPGAFLGARLDFKTDMAQTFKVIPP